MLVGNESHLNSSQVQAIFPELSEDNSEIKEKGALQRK